MKIKLFPVFSVETLSIAVLGEMIVINGDEIDLSVIPNEFRLPAVAIDNPFMVHGTYIERVEGEMSLSIRFPVLWETPDDIVNPLEPTVIKIENGEVQFPDIHPKTL